MDIPSWVTLVILVSSQLLAIGMAYGLIKADLRNIHEKFSDIKDEHKDLQRQGFQNTRDLKDHIERHHLGVK